MENDNSDSKILFVYESLPEVVDGEKGLWANSQISQKVGEIKTSELANNLKKFSAEVEQLFDGLTTTIRNYELDEVEIGVTITGKGEIALVSTIGGEIEGGIKLTFKKQKGS